MNHKEKMNWLKENDPIIYYEMNSNPTGTNSNTTGKNSNQSIIIFIIFTLIITLIFFKNF